MQNARGLTWPRSLASLSVRDFRLVWIGQLARGTNQWAQFTAVPLLVLELGGSAIDLGVVAAAQWAPVLLFGPWGGVVADRTPKRRTLLALQWVLVAQGATLLALVASGFITIPLLLGVSIVFGLANAIELPVRLAFLSDLVPRQWLSNAIVLQGGAFHVSRMIGPTVAGALVATVGYVGLFLVCLALAVIALVLLVGVAPSHRVRLKGGQSIGRDLAQGLGYAAGSSLLLAALVITLAVSALIYGVQAVLPVLALEVLSLDSLGYGVLLACMSAGAVLSAVPMGRLSLDRMSTTVALGSGGAGTGMIVLGTQTSAVLAIGGMFILGASGLMVLASLNTIVQTVAEERIRGRVIGLYVASFSAGVAGGGLIIGLVTHWLGVQQSMLICGLGMVALAVVVFKALPQNWATAARK